MLSLAACVPPGGMWPSNMYGAAGNSNAPAASAAPAERPPEVLGVTGSARSLQRLTTDDGHETRPRLSADGSRLLASTWRDEVVDEQYTGNRTEQMVISMRPDGRGRTALSKRGVAAYDAAWLPRSFVYVSNAMGAFQLVRAAKVAAGAAVSVVVRADDAPNIGSVSAAKDGSLLAFHMQVRDVWTIATVRPDGSDLMMLGDGTNPRISPDGTRLAYEKSVNNRWQVFTMDVVGGDVTPVTDLDATCGSPEWSPDGKWIVFSSNAGSARFSNPDGVLNLFAIRPDGSGLAQLTDGPRHTTEPAWGGDGWIYFASNENGTYDLWRLRPALE
jgi:Tol biopolymer transport system component